MSKKKKRKHAAPPPTTPQPAPAVAAAAGPRKIIIALSLLAAFLVIGGAWAAVRFSQDTVVSASQSAAPQPVAASAAPQEEDAPPASARKVVVYYFYGNARCYSCEVIEELTNFAVHNGFQAEMAQGTLEFAGVNVETPEQRHFIKDYQLYTKSVIVSEVVDGRETRWKNLEQIWRLFYDQRAFVAYVQQEIRAYLSEEEDQTP